MNKKVIISLFIALVMIMSIFGVILERQTEESENYVYNGFEFFQTKNGYYTTINAQRVVFNFLPDQVGDVFITNDIKDFIKENKNVTVTYNPSSNQAQQISQSLFWMEEKMKNQGYNFQKALTNSKGYELPEVTCGNASEKKPVIEFFESNQSRIFLENWCVKIAFTDFNELVAVTEKLSYMLLGVI